MDNRFNFAHDGLLPEEAAQLEAIRIAVDARAEAARAAKLAEWERQGERNGRGRRVLSGESVDVAVVRVTKTTIVTRAARGGEYTFSLVDGTEKGGRGYFDNRRLELTHVSPSLAEKLAAAGQDSRNRWARAAARAGGSTHG